MNSPEYLVGVSCITYNHARFLPDTLDGFVRQKTGFPFIVVIGNDHSPDGTEKILNDYQQRYPHLFRVLNHPENLGPMGNSMRVAENMPGVKYLAVCEGDDCWSDPLKLRKQVDFMESHPECNVCFHRAKVHYEGQDKPDEVTPSEAEIKEYFTGNLAGAECLADHNMIVTASVMYRTFCSGKELYRNYPPDIMPGDWYNHLLFLRNGKVGFIPDVMAVYRKHDGGIFAGLDRDRHAFYRRWGIPHCRFFEEAVKLLPPGSPEQKKMRTRFRKFVWEILSSGIAGRDTEMLERFFERYPAAVLNALTGQGGDDPAILALARNIYLFHRNSGSGLESAGKLLIRLALKVQEYGWKGVFQKTLWRIRSFRK